MRRGVTKAFARLRSGGLPRRIAPGPALRPLIAEYTATFGGTWPPVTRRKHADDFARFIDWLEGRRLPVTTGSLDFMTLVDT